jgi:hypothetical protein
MAEKEFYMRLHGDMLHNVVIFLTKCILLEKGATLKDERQFKKKYISPCEPDVYAEYEAKMIKGNTRRTEKKLLVVEVETKATTESIRKKYIQYQEATAGIDLVVLNLEKFLLVKGNSMYNWGQLQTWVESELPI